MARARISIIGLGLVGASIGLALRREKPQLEVVGHDISSDAAKQALKLGAIEKAEWNLLNACETADMLIFATPALAIKETFEILRKKDAQLKEGLIITDTASTKADVLRWAERLLPKHVYFVGGDPMVGRDGATAGPSADLFKGATYCLIPSPATPSDAIQRVQGLVELLGATAYFIDPLEHDGYAGFADHLPFLVSTALLRMAAAKQKEPTTRAEPAMHRMVGATFRRAVEFASDDPNTYRDVCLTNRESLVRWLGVMREQLDELSALVQEGDEKKLGDLFDQAYLLRRMINKPYIDADLEAQSNTIRNATGFGIGDLFGFRQRKPPEPKK
jgi:prephenate dehydrogenase